MIRRTIFLLRAVFVGNALAFAAGPAAAAADAPALKTATIQYREVDRTYAAADQAGLVSEYRKLLAGALY